MYIDNSILQFQSGEYFSSSYFFNQHEFLERIRIASQFCMHIQIGWKNWFWWIRQLRAWICIGSRSWLPFEHFEMRMKIMMDANMIMVWLFSVLFWCFTNIDETLNVWRERSQGTWNQNERTKIHTLRPSFCAGFGLFMRVWGFFAGSIVHLYIGSRSGLLLWSLVLKPKLSIHTPWLSFSAPLALS